MLCHMIFEDHIFTYSIIIRCPGPIELVQVSYFQTTLQLHLPDKHRLHVEMEESKVAFAFSNRVFFCDFLYSSQLSNSLS